MIFKPLFCIISNQLKNAKLHTLFSNRSNVMFNLFDNVIILNAIVKLTSPYFLNNFCSTKKGHEVAFLQKCVFSIS